MVDPMNPIVPLRPQEGPASPGPAQKGDGKTFSAYLKDSLQQVSQMQADADHAINELRLGRSENVADMLQAVEKADLAFQLLMEVRNKIIDAYQELERMRV